ncbi:hypothetical protein [Photobacterium damselae]|uniref:hypothetical protein n=1 Tax=Photobacterium damselae TaxID=38293 RepID=UPI004068B900
MNSFISQLIINCLRISKAANPNDALKFLNEFPNHISDQHHLEAWLVINASCDVDKVFGSANVKACLEDLKTFGTEEDNIDEYLLLLEELVKANPDLELLFAIDENLNPTTGQYTINSACAFIEPGLLEIKFESQNESNVGR